jgi:hypothetical protein
MSKKHQENTLSAFKLYDYTEFEIKVQIFLHFYESILALTLLMLRIFTDDANYAVATNYFAVAAHFFN